MLLYLNSLYKGSITLKNAIGIDNGISGTIGIINESEVKFLATPTKSEQNYTKKKGNISRVDFRKLFDILKPYKNDSFIMFERPLVNPTRFASTISAVRSLEATLIIIEILKIPHMYLDSKQWQKELLPKGIKGSPELKKASVDIGKRLFPQFAELINKHGDADGLLIAEYCRRVR